MSNEKQNLENAESQPLNIADVIGILSLSELKRFIYTGKNLDGSIVIDPLVLDDKALDLDFCLKNSFELADKYSYIDYKRVEEVFWRRLLALVNYR